MVDLKSLANWCRADYVEKRVNKIQGSEKRIFMEDGTSLEYDILAVNVGSKTRGAEGGDGVYQNSLTTRPINDLLSKIERKEQQLIKDK